VAFAAETAPFFTDFAATSCTIGGVAVSAIFSNRADDSLLAAGTQPVLTVESSAVAATARGTAVVVNGTNYTVAKIEPDGTGISRVILEKA
jgi:hypothetical protein